MVTKLQTMFALLLLLSTARVSAEVPVFCLNNTPCDHGRHCHWGVCVSDVSPVSGALFRVHCSRVLDRTPAAEGRNSTERIPRLLAVYLNQSGYFDAVAPARESPLLDTPDALAGRGFAYLIHGEISLSEGSPVLSLGMTNTITGESVPQLEAQLPLDDDTALQSWVNLITWHFTGRPGIVGGRLAAVSKLSWGVKEVFEFRLGEDIARQVTNDGKLAVLPAWTPDGRIAYTSFKTGEALVYIEGVEQPFTNNPPMNTGIDWSPDGSVAAVTMVQDDNADIYLVEGTTGEIRARLTHHPAIDTSPKWSPTGDRLVFVSDRTGTPQIYLMNADGSDLQRITHFGSYNTSPAWHPFADYIAYIGQSGAYQVYLLDLKTHETTMLTSSSGDHEDPVWSPDGRWITYTWARGERKELFMMRPDGTDNRLIRADGGKYFNPVWEPLPGHSKP